jgi:hypothetical protein
MFHGLNPYQQRRAEIRESALRLMCASMQINGAEVLGPEEAVPLVIKLYDETKNLFKKEEEEWKKKVEDALEKERAAYANRQQIEAVSNAYPLGSSMPLGMGDCNATPEGLG